jgi:hypothetical protein
MLAPRPALHQGPTYYHKAMYSAEEEAIVTDLRWRIHHFGHHGQFELLKQLRDEIDRLLIAPDYSSNTELSNILVSGMEKLLPPLGNR